MLAHENTELANLQRGKIELQGLLQKVMKDVEHEMRLTSKILKKYENFEDKNARS